MITSLRQPDALRFDLFHRSRSADNVSINSQSNRTVFVNRSDMPHNESGLNDPKAPEQQIRASRSHSRRKTQRTKPAKLAQNLKITLESDVLRRPDLAGTARQTEAVAVTKNDPDTVLIHRAAADPPPFVRFPRFRHHLVHRLRVTVPRI